MCVQLRLKLEIDSEDTDSDNESYITPPESNQEENSEEIITVGDDDPIDSNTAKLTEDETKLDTSDDDNSELDNSLNNPSNNTTIELGNLLNLPNILDIQGKQSDTSLSDDRIPGSMQKTPTKRQGKTGKTKRRLRSIFRSHFRIYLEYKR